MHSYTEILQDPSSQVVLPNDRATFTCIVQTSGDYYIYINGIPTLPDDIPGITIAISDQQNDVHIVSIVIAAQLSVNSTTVQCVVDTDSGEGSSVAYLLIAGKRCSFSLGCFKLPNKIIIYMHLYITYPSSAVASVPRTVAAQCHNTIPILDGTIYSDPCGGHSLLHCEGIQYRRSQMEIVECTSLPQHVLLPSGRN